MTSTPLLAFDQSGSGPPIVLLHPSGFGPAVLQQFASALATDHHVVIPHRRGYGGSIDLALPVTLDHHHDDVVRLMDHLGLDQPIVVGVSGGATLALGLARHAPGCAELTVAHEPLIGPLAPSLDARIHARIAKLLARADQPHETSLFMSELVGIATWNHLSTPIRDAVECNAVAARHEASLFTDFALTPDELAQLVSGRSGRVITTVGERSGAMRKEAAAVLARHGVASIEVPDTGHLPVVDQATAYATLVRSLRPTAAAAP